MKQRIVLIGPPASGKGTFARMIQSAYGFPTTSTGAILRKEKEAGTPLGLKIHELTSRGQFAPDDVVLSLVEQWLASLPAPASAFVFDGFPRTLQQGVALDKLLAARNLPLQLVLWLRLDRAEIERRVLSRVVCASCRYSASIGRDVASESDPCPKCGGRLERRADDTLPVLEARLSLYQRLTEPLIPFYEQQGLLAPVDAALPAEDVMRQITGLIGRPPASSPAV